MAKMITNSIEFSPRNSQMTTFSQNNESKKYFDDILYSLATECVCHRDKHSHENYKQHGSRVIAKSDIDEELSRICYKILETKTLTELAPNELNFLHQNVYISEMQMNPVKYPCRNVDLCKHQSKIIRLEKEVESSKAKLSKLK